MQISTRTKGASVLKQPILIFPLNSPGSRFPKFCKFSAFSIIKRAWIRTSSPAAVSSKPLCCLVKSLVASDSSNWAMATEIEGEEICIFSAAPIIDP